VFNQVALFAALLTSSTHKHKHSTVYQSERIEYTGHSRVGQWVSGVLGWDRMMLLISRVRSALA